MGQDARQERGRAGERYARQWVESRGWEVLDTNWRCRAGELDLVALDEHGRVRFVEVRSRSTSRWGTGAESVGRTKQRKVREVARHWLAAGHGRFRGVVFDVVSVDLSQPDRPLLEVFEDAF